MASKLHQLQSKAVQASQLVSKHGCTYYKQLLEQNKQYIQEPATVEKCNLLSKQLFYTRLARYSSCTFVILAFDIIFHLVGFGGVFPTPLCDELCAVVLSHKNYRQFENIEVLGTKYLAF
jgi:hypothetical protein